MDAPFEISWELEGDFVDMTQANRGRSATKAGMNAAIVITNTAPTILAGATLPQITFTMPSARFNPSTPNIGGPEGLTIALSGIAENTTGGTNDALSCAYRTTDATV